MFLFSSSIGVNGVSTLIACELFADVHSICSCQEEENELIFLRKYLVHGRGWKCLTVLNLLGVKGTSCGQELVALLLGLYPIIFQETSNFIPPNPYVKFRCNKDNDCINVICHLIKKNNKMKYSSKYNVIRRKRSRKFNISRMTQKHVRKRHCAAFHRSHESDEFSDTQSCANSLAQKVEFKSIDFGYFTSMFLNKSERKWKMNYAFGFIPVGTSYNETYEEFINQNVKAVFDLETSHFEINLLVLQLLEELQDYDFPTQHTLLVQVLEFTLDILWNLQFKIDVNLTSVQFARLKAAGSRLMLTFLRRIIKSEKLITTMVHNGFLPITLKLLEDTCKTSISVITFEERLCLQEFIFSITYGVISFLYFMLQQVKLSKNFDDFTQLFQLFMKNQNRKLIERTIVLLVHYNQIESAIKAEKIIDMIGALIITLKRVRQESIDADRENQNLERYNDPHHISDIFGYPYQSKSADSSILFQVRLTFQ